MKPLNGKLYGHIPHLPGSRVGLTDRYVHAGQAQIATVKPRDWRDIVVIQEKMDGCCVGATRISGELTALTRSGNLCVSSPYVQHRHFSAWMYHHADRFDCLQEGERIVGEWLGLAHGTIYDPTRVLGWEPFVAFDLMTGTIRVPYIKFQARMAGRFHIPPLVTIGAPQTIEWVQEECPTSRYGGEYVEGYIWRIERAGVVDFLCKWVAPWYIPGKYLEPPPMWNYKEF